MVLHLAIYIIYIYIYKFERKHVATNGIRTHVPLVTSRICYHNTTATNHCWKAILQSVYVYASFPSPGSFLFRVGWESNHNLIYNKRECNNCYKNIANFILYRFEFSAIVREKLPDKIVSFYIWTNCSIFIP